MITFEDVEVVPYYQVINKAVTSSYDNRDSSLSYNVEGLFLLNLNIPKYASKSFNTKICASDNNENKTCNKLTIVVDNEVDYNYSSYEYTAPKTTINNASAKCKDGTLSYSSTRSGTCSHHGGVAVWY